VITTLSTTSHPDRFEGRIDSGLDRFQVVEMDGSGHPVAVHERFGTRAFAEDYAALRAEQTPAMYGPDAAHGLVVWDVVNGVVWRRR
jgi:hypothetical protein